jgi:hypothetical protein
MQFDQPPSDTVPSQGPGEDDGRPSSDAGCAAPRAVASSGLGADLLTAFWRRGGGRPGGWVILDAPEVHVVGQVLVPDIGWLRRERMPQDLACSWAQ